MRNRAAAKNYNAWFDARVVHGCFIYGNETAEHYIWRGMIQRCTSKKLKYKYYSNVKVCKRWLKYENFYADMGPRPSVLYSLDRINPFGNYEPSNCRWATWSQQQKNKRNTKYLLQGNKIGTMSEWAEWLGMSRALASWRWKNWGTFEKGKTWQLRQKAQ
jgi:hypothetical protein